MSETDMSNLKEPYASRPITAAINNKNKFNRPTHYIKSLLFIYLLKYFKI